MFPRKAFHGFSWKQTSARLVQITARGLSRYYCLHFFCVTLDEVRVKTKVIERTKAKLESAEEDVQDLCAEFELERQDYLSTIRSQDKAIKLYEQLLGTVVPCLRRDCNYFNIDKIRVDCTWNEDSGHWDLPKLTINKTVLSPAALPAALPKGAGLRERKGSKGTTPVHNVLQSSSSEINARGSSNSLLSHGSAGLCENLDEDKPRPFQLKSDDSAEYFRPKRARELMGHHSPHVTTKDGFSPLHNHVTDIPPLAVRGSGSLSSLPLSSLPNAAAVHRIDPLLDANYGRRPGKLQSLARNPPVPTSFAAHQDTDILEKVEKKLVNSKKNLEPLGDIKHKKHSHN